MTTKRINVLQDEENEVTVDVIATSIVAISAGINKLRKGPLNEKAILLLVTAACPSLARGKRLSQHEVRTVLDGLSSLESAFLKPKK